MVYTIMLSLHMLRTKARKMLRCSNRGTKKWPDLFCALFVLVWPLSILHSTRPAIYGASTCTESNFPLLFSHTGL